MGYDSLRIELRYRHIWQTKWAAAATNEDGVSQTSNGSQTAGSTGNTTSNLTPPQQSSQRGRRSTSLNRNVHYETEPDPGVDSPIGTKLPPTSNAQTGQPANAATRGRRGQTAYKHYK